MTNELFWLRPWDDSEHEPTIREAFKDWATGSGIFDEIMTLAVMPWASDSNATADILDLEYFGNHSGGKYCSPLVKFLINDDGYIPDAGRTTLAKIIVAKYLQPWTRLWMTNVVAYSPINNYDMTETRNLSAEVDETVVTDKDETNTGTDTLTHGLVDETTHGKTTDEVTYRYGMNNVERKEKPADEFTSEEGGTTTVEQTGDDVQTKDLASTEDSTVTTDNNRTENETTHRIGNIGVTTNQKLIQEERNLWLWNFFNHVFKDIDNELTLAISDPCRV